MDRFLAATVKEMGKRDAALCTQTYGFYWIDRHSSLRLCPLEILDEKAKERHFARTAKAMRRA